MIKLNIVLKSFFIALAALIIANNLILTSRSLNRCYSILNDIKAE